jgi:hypothetical protein
LTGDVEAAIAKAEGVDAPDPTVDRSIPTASGMVHT